MFSWFKKKKISSINSKKYILELNWEECQFIDYMKKSNEELQYFIQDDVQLEEKNLQLLRSMGIRTDHNAISITSEQAKTINDFLQEGFYFLTDIQLTSLKSKEKLHCAVTTDFNKVFDTKMAKHLIKINDFIDMYCDLKVCLHKNKGDSNWSVCKEYEYESFKYTKDYKKENRLLIVSHHSEFDSYSTYNKKPIENDRLILLPLINNKLYLCVGYWYGDRKRKIETIVNDV